MSVSSLGMVLISSTWKLPLVGTPLVEIMVLEEEKEELALAQVELGPFAAWAPETQAP